MSEIERSILADKVFNANLVQCLAPDFVIISNVHICSLICTISHVYMRPPKTVLHALSLVYEKIIIYECLL